MNTISRKNEGKIAFIITKERNFRHRFTLHTHSYKPHAEKFAVLQSQNYEECEASLHRGIN